MAKAKVNKARRARDENNAALKIQSIQRGKMGRRRFSQKKQEQDTLSMESEVLEQSRRDARNAELAQEAAERRALEEMEQKAAEEAATAKIQAAARGRSEERRPNVDVKPCKRRNSARLQFVFRSCNVVRRHERGWKHSVDQETKFWSSNKLMIGPRVRRRKKSRRRRR